MCGFYGEGEYSPVAEQKATFRRCRRNNGDLSQKEKITSLGGGQHRVCLVCGNAAARLPHIFRAEARPHFYLHFGGKYETERYQVQHPYGC